MRWRENGEFALRASGTVLQWNSDTLHAGGSFCGWDEEIVEKMWELFFG